MPFDFWTAYWTFTAFVFGAIVGSFLNVCVWRLPRGESLSDPPSHCPSCNHRLAFVPDMVPLLSQLWYRSRCRHCGTHFSWRYFWVEVFTAVTFAGLYLRYVYFGPPELSELARTWSAGCAMVYAAALITIFFIDLETYKIPDPVVLLAVLAAVAKDIGLIVAGHRDLWQVIPGTSLSVPIPVSIIGGLLGLWLLWQFAALCSALLAKEAMGAGDSLLLGAMGAFLLPWPLAILAFMIAVFLGAFGGVIGIMLSGRAGDEAPTAAGSVAATEAADPLTVSADSAGMEEQATYRSEQALVGEGIPDLVAATADSAEPGARAGGSGFAEDSGSRRGAVDLGEGEPAPNSEELEVPPLPPDSRWGRVWTVLASWIGVGSVWGGAVLFERSGATGIALGLVGVIVALGLGYFGLRRWLRGDEEWIPAMDALFDEGDPGPRFIPFGPYLVAGTLLAMFFGKPLVEYYASTVLMLPPEALQGLGWD